MMMNNEDQDKLIDDQQNTVEDDHVDNSNRGNRIGYITIAVLTFTNLLNYMDRFTVAGVLNDIETTYFPGTTDNLQKLGLIQSAFIISYMIFSPLFGILGDRYNRKTLMAIGIGFWSLITLGSSFATKYFPSFLIMRALVGIGEASYSTIAPTIIADLFCGSMRTNMLSVFYFAIPVGSGLGYIVGSKIAALKHDWRWAFRITPVFGLVCMFLILFLIKEPKRGASEGGGVSRQTSVYKDLKYLCNNLSYLFSTFAFTCVAFVTGALALWTPFYLTESIKAQQERTGKIYPVMSDDTVSLTFGIITCLAGFFGVLLGWNAAKVFRRYTERADPFVCAFGMIACAPFLFLSLYLSRTNIIVTFVLIFIGETLLCMNWPIVADILLYVVIPTRRSIAEAGQILISHLFGDAGSPFIIGVISDSIAHDFSKKNFTQTYIQYKSLQYSLYLTCFISVIGGGFFLATSLYVVKDKAKQKSDVRDSAAIFPNNGIDGNSDASLPNVLNEY